MGAIIIRNLRNNAESLVLESSLTSNIYLGYSMTNYPSGKNIVVSAPRNKHFDGKVFFFSFNPWKSKNNS
jgi:hypothetical protein